MTRHLYVVDDDADVRDAIAFAAEVRGFEVHLYEDGTDLLNEPSLCSPGCILLDLKMPVINGIALQQKLADNGIRLPVIVVSGHATVDATIQAFRQGVDDFLVKPVDSTRMFDRIEELVVRDDERLKQERLADEARERYRSLTGRETQVMELLIRGLSGKQIAANLGISYRTMEKFRANVMRKFQTQSVAELVHAAFRIGLACQCTLETESQDSEQVD
jgi:two-component system response regulator FixJ